MSSFASGSSPGINSATTVPVSDDQNPLTTQRPDDSQSKLSFKSISSAASGWSAPFLRWRSSTNRSRTKHESKRDKENKRVYKLIPMSELVAESPFTETSADKRMTMTWKYEFAENAEDKHRESKQKIRLTITCEITKSDGKYAQFTKPYFDTLDNLKVSVPTSIRAESFNRLKDDDNVYRVAKTFLDDLFERMF